MNTWKLILATMVIFGTGVVTGGLLVRHSEFARVRQIQRPPGQVRPVVAPSPGGMRLEFLRRIQRELDLSPEQRELVDKALKESQERSKKIMEPVAPGLRLEIQRAKEEFRSILRQDQRDRFDELLKHPQRPREQRHPNVPKQAPDRSDVEAQTPQVD